MSLLICRIISVILLLGGIAFFLSKVSNFEDLQPRLKQEMETLKQLEFVHAEEMNSTQLEISKLLMERSKLRREYEEIEEKITGFNEEKSFLMPKQQQLELKHKKVDEEVVDIERKIGSLRDIVEKEISKQKPYADRISSLEKELNDGAVKLSATQDELEKMEKNFSTVTNIRNIAHKSFLSNKDLLLAEIVKPNHLFYDDQTEIFVENVAPSKTGFFVKKGEGAGFRENQIFIASKNKNFEDQIFRLRCKFADEELSFFEREQVQDGSNDLQLRAGENLFLIRTGDFPSEEDSSFTDND